MTANIGPPGPRWTIVPDRTSRTGRAGPSLLGRARRSYSVTSPPPRRAAFPPRSPTLTPTLRSCAHGVALAVTSAVAVPVPTLAQGPPGTDIHLVALTLRDSGVVV